MAAVENETFWKEFIELYKSLPELWQVKNERFKKKPLKEKAYRILLQKLREVQPYATDSTLKRKLNILKESYRHELSKVRRSEKLAKNPEDVYTPALWFFNELSFLGEQEASLSDTGPSDNDDPILEGKAPAVPIPKELEKGNSASTKHKSLRRSPHRSRIVDRQVDKSKLLQKLRRNKTPSDDSQIFSATWAALFRKLEPPQQVHANKAIMDILYQGQLSSIDDLKHTKLGSSSDLSIHSSNDRLTDNLLNDYAWKH